MKHVILTPKDYFEMTYVNGKETKHSDMPCPACGDTNCWDLDDNVHGGIEDKIRYRCECGAEWFEYWTISRVELNIPEK